MQCSILRGSFDHLVGSGLLDHRCGERPRASRIACRPKVRLALRLGVHRGDNALSWINGKAGRCT
jgi:hypothetical protein